MKRMLVVAAAAALISGCSGQHRTASTTQSHVYSSLANGRAIFQTGRDFDGVQIQAKSHPLFNNCEACHRADGSGGRHFSDGATSADLRFQALVVQQKHPYDITSLERAISTGIDNEGKPLDPVMPRWKLSARDLHDIALYVHLKLK
ncbi:MAG TPA: c-type cytochrome [Candidatus Eremiobacteraceae bacterium]|nr:c-type cytochrome [Candidatus Eremiobacteraceae bacterium]